MRFTKNQILLFGFAIHILAAVFSIGYHQCDELFQVYEFAGYKLGLNSAADLPWEFHEQMRSGIQPLIVYGITKAFHSIAVTNPFSIACFIRLCMALLSFWATVLLTNQLEKEILTEKLKQWLWLAALLFWCLPYFHARFSSENFSATLFMFGLAILQRVRLSGVEATYVTSHPQRPSEQIIRAESRRTRSHFERSREGALTNVDKVIDDEKSSMYSHPERSRREGKLPHVRLSGVEAAPDNVHRRKTLAFPLFLLSGILFGLAFHSRFQICFMIAGLLAWLVYINKTSIKHIVVLVFGIIIATALGLVCDHWLYNRWTLSWWNYLDLNLFQDKASVYGRQPFYFFFEQAVLQLIPPFSLVILFCIIAFWVKFKTHFLTWVTVPFTLIHFFVAHKELRFLFPVLNFIPFMLILYFQQIETSQNKWTLFFKKRSFLKFAIVVNGVALLIFTFSPADGTSHYLKQIYNRVEGQHPVLYYNGNNPYNNLASLNYFRNPAIRTVDLANDTITQTTEVYYFSEKFNEDNRVTKNGRQFQKIYSNFPAWFSYLNFNGWLDRATAFSIYRSI